MSSVASEPAERFTSRRARAALRVALSYYVTNGMSTALGLLLISGTVHLLLGRITREQALAALGAVFAFVIVAADGRPLRFFAHLQNLSTHYLFADPAARARFDGQVLVLFLGVVGLFGRAEHAVGERREPRPVLLELACEPVCVVHRSRFHFACGLWK